MNKLPSRKLLVAAALLSLTAESAWSEEAAPSEPAAPAAQTAWPEVASSPGYAPTSYQGGYEPYWQPPPWPAPPPGYYGHYPPYYPPQPQYRSAPAAPAENPLSGKLKQTEEQLTNLQAEHQAIQEAMQQAQAELAKAGEQLSIVIEEMDILNEVLSGLKARLDVQNTSLLGALQAGTAEGDKVEGAAASEAGQVEAPVAPSVQPESAVSEPTQAINNEPVKPVAE